MADGGKGASSFWYHFGMTLAVIGFGFFVYIKLTDTEFFMLNHIIHCYTICFAAALVFMLGRIGWVFSKSGKKFTYQLWLMSAAGVMIVACFVNNVAEDFGKSKTKKIIDIDETRKVILCEADIEYGHTRIDVYNVKGRFVKKAGEIDEKLFSVKCLAEEKYSYRLEDDNTAIIISCEYGTFGDADGNIVLDPKYTDKTLSYRFELD